MMPLMLALMVPLSVSQTLPAATHEPPIHAGLADPNILDVRPWVDGAIYSLKAAPGQLSSIALEPGERLVSVATGDTAQWVIGDTTSGSGGALQSHILVKPVLAGLRTNMMIMTDRRVYHLALESSTRAPLTSLRWSYGAPRLIALERRSDPACEKPALVTDPSSLNFNYRIEGEAAWRPVRAFDDGRQTYIEFPPTFAQAEAPPLFLKGADGGLELVNYRLKGRYYVVDRIFAAAELRLGEKKQQKVSIVRVPVIAPQPKSRRSS